MVYQHKYLEKDSNYFGKYRQRGLNFVKDYIEERALEIANYIINERATVRQTASVFGVSKSTVHKDVTERLPRINPLVAGKVKNVLDMNKAERHIRGGKATKMKYKAINH
jgi:putative DeoR family transcriptional regulator, stage III sporulation protein D